MKKIFKILLFLILSISIFSIFSEITNASIVDFSGVDATTKELISKKSLTLTPGSDIGNSIDLIGTKILKVIKYIVYGLLLVFLVYTGIQMILSMGSDEESLSKSKRQIRYILIGILFINIPGTIYKAFEADKRGGSISDGISEVTWKADSTTNIFINSDKFIELLNSSVIEFIEMVIFGVAIFIIILSGIQIMGSAGKDEDVSESKKKILWSLIGLVFISFIEGIKAFVYTGNFGGTENYSLVSLFKVFENLLLYFAGPVAIFFLILSGYYFVTSNGDDEKIKKAKSIVLNTLIATVILLAAHTFLSDLSTGYLATY